jgi:hypothetical protein
LTDREFTWSLPTAPATALTPSAIASPPVAAIRPATATTIAGYGRRRTSFRIPPSDLRSTEHPTLCGSGSTREAPNVQVDLRYIALMPEPSRSDHTRNGSKGAQLPPRERELRAPRADATLAAA